VMLVALFGCVYYTWQQRHIATPTAWGIILWADVTVLVAAFCLTVVFFGDINADIYCRIKDNNTLIAAAIAASALAWQTMFGSRLVARSDA
jgi:hypothetical protein